jgi:tRNA A-37 threonylcarbamoyl transferase component Bud32
MYIDQEFLTKQNIVSFQFIRRFYSKKNEVSLVQFTDSLGLKREWVVKKYNDPKNIKMEGEILKQLYTGGLSVPKMIHVGVTSIIMENIKGITLLEWIEDKEKESVAKPGCRVEVLKTIEELAHWLKRFYEIMAVADSENIILGDTNFRNFIVADKLYGVDFENCQRGKVEEDIGKLCAFALTYDPPFTEWKCMLADAINEIMSDILQISSGSINVEMIKELTEIFRRRKLKKNHTVIANL